MAMMSELLGIKEPIDFVQREKNRKKDLLKLSMVDKMKSTFSKSFYAKNQSNDRSSMKVFPSNMSANVASETNYESI